MNVVRILTSHGASLEAENRSGKTPAEVALKKGYLSLLSLLEGKKDDDPVTDKLQSNEASTDDTTSRLTSIDDSTPVVEIRSIEGDSILGERATIQTFIQAPAGLHDVKVHVNEMEIPFTNARTLRETPLGEISLGTIDLSLYSLANRP